MITERLLTLREKAGMSQEVIAKKLGVARTTYASYEQGKREPDLSMLEKMADLFEVSVDFLVRNETKKESEYPLSESEYDQIIREAEKQYGVNLRDDPFVLQTMKQIIDNYAQTKRNR